MAQLGDLNSWFDNQDKSHIKHNYSATTAPAVTNDVSEGYSVGSMWFNISSDVAYVCLDITDGAAVWTDITAGAGGGDAWSDAVDAIITPDADGTRDLATTSTRFATAYVDDLDVTTNIVVGGTVDGRDIATDGTKLDGIEALADVTDEANVTSSLDGATLTTVTAASADKVLIQDASDADNLKVVAASEFLGGGGGSSTFDGLTDTTITAIASGEIIKWNGSAYINNTLAEAGISATGHTHTLSDVTDSGALAPLDTVGTSEIDNNAVTLAKVEDIPTNRLLGRNTAGTGDVEAITLPSVRTMLNVEDGATADQTGAEIKTAYEAELDTNAFTDAEQTKLSGIETSADVTDATNVAAAGAVMDGDFSTSGVAVRTGAGTYTSRTITGTANEITVTDGDGVSGNPTFSLPATIDLGGKTSFELPNGAAPTVNADGEIALDTTVTDFSHGVLKYYGGEEMAIVAMPIAELTTPTDGYVVSYNATTDEFELAAGGGGSSSPTTTQGDMIRHNGTADERLALGLEGYKVGSDGTDAVYLGPQNCQYFYDDFTDDEHLMTINTASSGGVNNLGQDANSRGVISHRISTTVGSRSSIYNGNSGTKINIIRLGNGIVHYEARVRVSKSQTASDTWAYRIGMAADLRDGPGTDGLYFETNYDLYSNNNWHAVERSSSTDTATDTGIAADDNAWHNLRIEVNSAGTSAAFYIDGVLEHTETISMAGQDYGFGSEQKRIAYSAVTNPDIYVDYMELYQGVDRT